MGHLSRWMAEAPLQYTVFLVLSVIIFILTAITYFSSGSIFQRFFGNINPLFIVFIVILIGGMLFSYLHSDGRFVIFRSGTLMGPFLAVGLAIPLATVMVLVDRKFPFPVDINIAYPNSLTFYPVMGFVVEILFHVLPVSLLYLILGFLVGESGTERGIWLIFLIVALIEPVFQVVHALGRNSAWPIAYMGLHLLLINYVQLLLFRRYDFVSMYAFRFSYYVIWHMVWGHLRLKLLF